MTLFEKYSSCHSYTRSIPPCFSIWKTSSGTTNFHWLLYLVLSFVKYLMLFPVLHLHRPINSSERCNRPLLCSSINPVFWYKNCISYEDKYLINWFSSKCGKEVMQFRSSSSAIDYGTKSAVAFVMPAKWGESMRTNQSIPVLIPVAVDLLKASNTVPSTK